MNLNKLSISQKKVYKKYFSSKKISDLKNLSTKEKKLIFKRAFVDFQNDKISFDEFCFIAGNMTIYPSKKTDDFEDELFFLLANTCEMKYYIKRPEHVGLYKKTLEDLFKYFELKE